MKARINFLLNRIREDLFKLRNCKSNIELDSLVADILDYYIDLELALYEMMKNMEFENESK